MELTQYTPLPPESAQELAEKLDGLLADYQLYHQNVRKIYWEPRLRPFLDFTEKMDRLNEYTHHSKQDIAEQIVMLGQAPTSTAVDSTTALIRNRITTLEKVSGFEQSIWTIIKGARELLVSVKEVFVLAADLQEEHTMELMQRLAAQLSIAIGIFSSVRAAQLN